MGKTKIQFAFTVLLEGALLWEIKKRTKYQERTEQKKEMTDNTVTRKAGGQKKKITSIYFVKLELLFFAESNLTSGQLALSIMALGACQNPNTYFEQDRYLIRQLETKFEAEIENMGENQMSRDPGQPCLLLH